MDNERTILENTIKKTIFEDERTVLENFNDKTIIENLNNLNNNEKTIIEKNTNKPLTEKLNNFKKNKIIKEFPALGSEADIYLLENGFILKLYRKGITINEEILIKIKKLSEKNPYIIRVIDFGFDREKNRYYEIMEYAKYGSVGDFFIESPANKTQIKTLVSQINEALKYIHQEGIIHRDLKPTNILVKSVNPLIFAISDFGISSVLDNNATKKLTQIKGTPVYSAPESFTGIIGQEVDYWSLGMIILEILHKNPFKGLNPQTIMFKITSESVEISKDIDDDVKTLLQGLLTQNRKYRWGYSQVKNWLEGKEEKVYYSFKESKNVTKYNFLGKKFNTLEELIKEATKDKDTFQKFITFVKRGYINQQLMENGEVELDLQLSEIIEEESSNILLGVAVIKLFAPNLIPKIYGISFDALNLLRILYKGKNKKSLTNEENQIYYILNSYHKREKLFKYLKDKKLEESFKIYSDIKKKTNNELFSIRVTANYINPENIMPTNYKEAIEENLVEILITPITKKQLNLLNNTLEKLEFDKIEETLIKNLDIEEFKLVRDALRNIPENVNNQDIEKTIKKIEEIFENNEKNLVPKEIKNLLYTGYEELHKLVEDISALLKISQNIKTLDKIEKKEFNNIQNIYRTLYIDKDYLIPSEAKYILNFDVENISLKDWEYVITDFKIAKNFYIENKKEIDELIGS